MLLFIITLFTSCVVNDSMSNVVYLYKYIQIGLFFYVFSVTLPYVGKYKDYFILAIAICCLYESILGFCQIIRFLRTEFYLFSCTGSFKNPGPYGGFLATCSSVLFAYALKGSNKTLKTISAYSLLPVVIVLPATMSRAAFLGFGLSLFCLLLSVNSFKKHFLKNWFLYAIASLALGTVLYYLKQGSADGRFHMNHMSAKMIYTHGLFGVGLGNYAGQYGKTQACFFKEEMTKGDEELDWTAINDNNRMSADCPEFAYNEYLQLGVECGPLCMLCFIGVLVFYIYYACKNQCVWLYGLICFSVFAFFSYPLNSVQFRLLLSFLLAASVPSNKSKLLRLEDVVVASGLVFFSISIEPKLKHEIDSLRKVSEIKLWFKRERYDYVIEDCGKLSCDVHITDYYYMYGKSLSEIGEYQKSDSVLMIGANSSSDPMFWNVMGNNSLAQGNYREAEERYKYAFYMLPNRLYPLYLLAKLYYIEGDTSKFLDMANRINTFIPKVESANTERLRSEIQNLTDNILID